MKRAIETTLHEWKNEEDRRPLLIRGARQIGKSFTVTAFGNEHFENIVEINFDLYPQMKSAFSTKDPFDIVQNISLAVGKDIVPGKTLLFLDEIQECPEAISSLRYFYEKMPKLHVIGAGSLLEFCFNSKDFRMPVGRVQYLYMAPLSFTEFLDALGENRLHVFLESMTLSSPVSEAVHSRLLALVKEYLIIGGMPAVVKEYVGKKSPLTFQNTQLSILHTYKDDFGKYAGRAKHVYLQKVFSTAPAMVGERYKYSNVDRDIKSRELKEALELLAGAGILTKICATSGHGLPFGAGADEKKFKILFLDTGLMQRACGLDSEIAMNTNFLSINSGAVAEQFVGQELKAYTNRYEPPQLYFWNREKKGSNAEIDYLTKVSSDIIPIEVKSGKTGTLKSLQLFIKEHNSKLGVRFSALPLSYYDNILSIPVYAIKQMPTLIKEARSRGTEERRLNSL